MGCGASSEGGAAAPVAKAPVDDGFGTDVAEFVLKVLSDEQYAENLLETLQSQENPENKVERLLKIVLSVIGTVANVTTPKHAMSEFLVGCLVAFLVNLTVRFKAPEKQMDIKGVQELGYHIDAKWAHALYDQEKCDDPKTALVEAMAREPIPQIIKPEDVVYFRPDSELGKPAVALVLDHNRGLILMVVRGTANLADAITDLAGQAVSWCDGYAHEYVALAAKTLFQENRSQLLELKKQYQQYGVRTVGHSLGGGVSGCLALLMHHDNEFAEAIYGTVPQPGKKNKGAYMITSVGFGSAAVMSKDLTEEVHRYVSTIVHDSDMVPRLCTNNISDFIVVADALVDTFKVVGAEMKKLMDGEEPEGYDGFKVLSLISKAASDPAGLLRDLLDEKLDKAEDAVEIAADNDPKRLYAPGRLILLARPDQGGSYVISRGSMAGGASQLLMKGKMVSDHSVDSYMQAVCTGEVQLTVATA